MTLQHSLAPHTPGRYIYFDSGFVSLFTCGQLICSRPPDIIGRYSLRERLAQHPLRLALILQALAPLRSTIILALERAQVTELLA